MDQSPNWDPPRIVPIYEPGQSTPIYEWVNKPATPDTFENLYEQWSRILEENPEPELWRRSPEAYEAGTAWLEQRRADVERLAGSLGQLVSEWHEYERIVERARGAVEDTAEGAVSGLEALFDWCRGDIAEEIAMLESCQSEMRYDLAIYADDLVDLRDDLDLDLDDLDDEAEGS